MENGKTKATRDSDLSKELGLKSWGDKRVRAFLICYHCGKRRCIYSARDDDYIACMEVLQQKLEAMSERYSCGDLLFDDSHRDGYYNNEGRRLKLREICIHCGEGGSSDFLLSLPQLQEHCMTDGYNSFPICTACLAIGKKVVKGGKKDNMQA